MCPRGQSKTGTAERREQLRRAKRAQRVRERRAGIVNVQLAVPKELAEKLAVARRADDFPQQLEQALDRIVIRIDDYPQLKDLAWNRTDRFIRAKEALQLYERNWRFVEPARLEPRERALLEQLKTRFGGGEINA